MTLQYPQLTYDADVTGCPQAQPGHLLGCDEVGRFYEVIDTEFVNFATSDHVCGRLYDHTHVNLQYATTESLQAAQARAQARTRKSED